jgi:hypothetical protein
MQQAFVIPQLVRPFRSRSAFGLAGDVFFDAYTADAVG